MAGARYRWVMYFKIFGICGVSNSLFCLCCFILIYRNCHHICNIIQPPVTSLPGLGKSPSDNIARLNVIQIIIFNNLFFKVTVFVSVDVSCKKRTKHTKSKFELLGDKN